MGRQGCSLKRQAHVFIREQQRPGDWRELRSLQFEEKKCEHVECGHLYIGSVTVWASTGLVQVSETDLSLM